MYKYSSKSLVKANLAIARFLCMRPNVQNKVTTYDKSEIDHNLQTIKSTVCVHKFNNRDRQWA